MTQQSTTDPYASTTEVPIKPAPRRTDVATGARYGASLVAVLLGAYLVAGQSIWPLVQVTVFGGGDVELAALLVSRYAFAVVVLGVGLLLAPTSVARRLLAAAIALVLVVLGAVLMGMRLTGGLRVPVESAIVLHPAFVATLAATAGWLIVRERHPLAFLLLLATIVVGLVPHVLALQGVASAVSELVTVPLAAVIGVGIAWAAAGISRALRGR